MLCHEKKKVVSALSVGYIDLSKRRVSPEEAIKCEDKFTKSKTVSLIVSKCLVCFSFVFSQQETLLFILLHDKQASPLLPLPSKHYSTPTLLTC